MNFPIPVREISNPERTGFNINASFLQDRLIISFASHEGTLYHRKLPLNSFAYVNVDGKIFTLNFPDVKVVTLYNPECIYDIEADALTIHLRPLRDDDNIRCYPDETYTIVLETSNELITGIEIIGVRDHIPI
jgi:hypothetical protein